MNKEEKRLSGVLTHDEHARLTQKLKQLTSGSKVSVADFVVASLDVSNETLKPLIDEVIRRKTQARKRQMGDPLSQLNVSDEARREIEAILAREAEKKSVGQRA